MSCVKKIRLVSLNPRHICEALDNIGLSGLTLIAKTPENSHTIYINVRQYFLLSDVGDKLDYVEKQILGNGRYATPAYISLEIHYTKHA